MVEAVQSQYKWKTPHPAGSSPLPAAAAQNTPAETGSEKLLPSPVKCISPAPGPIPASREPVEVLIHGRHIYLGILIMMVQNYCDHFGSSLFCNFIYRDRRQSSPLPQQIKPDAGKGHSIQSSDLLHIFLSVSLGGVAYRQPSGVILFLQHGGAMLALFNDCAIFSSLLKNKKAGHPGAVTPKCPAQIYLIIF